MPVSPDLVAAMQQVDLESSNIGATIQPIADRIARLSGQLAGSMTAEEQAAAATELGNDAQALNAAAAALMALGQDPTNPVPVPTPAPPPESTPSGATGSTTGSKHRGK